MPSTTVFDKQSKEYQQSILSDKPIITIEASQTDMWYKYIRNGGDVVGIDVFGESAPAGELYKHFKITSENVVQKAKKLLG